MPQIFVPLTATLKNKTKWMNLLLEKVESPGSQRTAVNLVLRGVTLLVCGFVRLVLRDVTNISVIHGNKE